METTQEFNYDSWRNQGAQALNSLKEKQQELLGELNEVESMIHNIECDLGIAEKKPKRIRIRPVIMAQVEANKGKWVEEDVIVDAVMANLEDVDVSSVKTALSRAVRDLDVLEEKEGKIRLKKE